MPQESQHRGTSYRLKVTLLVATILLVIGVLLAGSAGHRILHRVSPEPYNVILVSVDTLRPDHLGCYGYGPNTSPAVDRLCDDSVLFSLAVAHAPSTLASHASILSSLLPQHHGALHALRRALGGNILTLGEVLKLNGYTSASFNGGAQVAGEFGLDQGFDTYKTVDRFSFRALVDEAVRWIEAQDREPFFLFLHTFEVHHPYESDEEWLNLFRDPMYSGPLPEQISVDLLREISEGKRSIDQSDLQHIINAYDAGIRSMDSSFGNLVDRLQALDLYDNTIIIFTSDHGEEFGEHGWVGWHSHTLYDELLLVPLIVKLPRSAHAGESVDVQVRSIDIAPTILDLLGIDIPETFEGDSLLSLVDAWTPVSRPAVSLQDSKLADHASLRTERWKLYDGRLYDLAADPGETRDVADDNRETVEQLQLLLNQLTAPGPNPGSLPVELDDDTQKRLRSLGYVD